jgi:metallophosphoesterase superfamily enzyme
MAYEAMFATHLHPVVVVVVVVVVIVGGSMFAQTSAKKKQNLINPSIRLYT